MTGVQTTLLGMIAGGTIFLGLPLGRVQGLSPRLRSFLTMVSAGILLFIFYDVMAAASGSVEDAMVQGQDGGASAPFVRDAGMLAAGFAAGALGLGWIDA